MADLTAWIEQQKALWTRAYDEVIVPDLEEQWKKRDRDHKNELKEKEENQQILFSHLNEEIQKTARLTRENERLQQELRRLDDAVANSDNSSLLQEELRQLTERFGELTRKYQDISQKAKYLERKNHTVMQKNKDMKESVRAWQEYADRQSVKQKPKLETRTEEPHSRLTEEPRSRLLSPYHLHDDRPHVPSSPGSIATVRTPATSADPGRSSPAPMVPLPQSLDRKADQMKGHSQTPISNTDKEHRRSSGFTTPKPAPQSARRRRDWGTEGALLASPSLRLNAITDGEEHTYAHLQQANPNSSQTTVDEPAERATLSRNLEVEEDDVPQFVSERSLKRKRTQPSKSKFQIYADRISDGTPARPYNVKDEPRSSPPIDVSTFMLRKETFDLDEPAPSMLKTPHHPQKIPSSHSNSTCTPRHLRSNSAPFFQSIKGQDLDHTHIPETTSSDLVTSHRGIIGLPLSTTEERAYSEPTDLVLPGESVLRSLDPNVPSSVSEEPPNKRPRCSGAQWSVKHNMLAESGDTSENLDDQLRLPPRVARAQMNQRLLTAKNPHTPLKSSLQTPNSEPSRIRVKQMSTPSAGISRPRHTPHTTGHNPRSNHRDDPTPGDRQLWTMKAPEPRASSRKTRHTPSKQQGRLRDRPHTDLSIQDFKPNPAYNQGYSYAFSETVRKRGDRMCLPGCTNLQCCGSTIRTFAEAQAPLPASQEEALLEDYLGEAYNNMQLTQMSPEERQELVLQARTKKMAKESGKHREAYEGKRTPPGFWRVDFPTTQEQQEDREKAKEMEKHEIERRWLEAQRKGGKWVFRDE